MKSAKVGAFTPRKSASNFFSPEGWMLNIYQHTWPIMKKREKEKAEKWGEIHF